MKMFKVGKFINGKLVRTDMVQEDMLISILNVKEDSNTYRMVIDSEVKEKPIFKNEPIKIKEEIPIEIKLSPSTLTPLIKPDYSTMDSDQLRQIAIDKGLKVGNMKVKEKLIKLLNDN